MGGERREHDCMDIGGGPSLKDHVEKHGECKWKLLAKQLPGRKGVDCRKRWFKSDVTMVEGEEIKDDAKHSDFKSDVVMVEGDEVSDTINRGGWTKEEDEAILKYGQEKGTDTD